ncbi:4Fe-4S binding protein [candidate division KSB1 bacterium]|nr:4Fe-4S binding protein [candidate division KSB1 bacterium]
MASRKYLDAPTITTFLLTMTLLTFLQLKLPNPMLLLERYVPRGGWLEIFALALYASWIFKKSRDPFQSPKWRLRIWLGFSIVFFGQLLLGLAGMDRMLMTGQLHLPVPAMIVVGPIFRGERFFMPILFLSTVLLVGPAWCSYLCYVGAWDGFAASQRNRPMKMPRWRRTVQIIILFAVIVVTMLLRMVGVSGIIAIWMAAAFGIGGVGLMVSVSRKRGVMTHCTSYCPMGALATWLGKLNPFRIRITSSCTECGRCSLACRYDALKMADIKRRQPGSSCTLCGDCLGSCRDQSLEYRFLKMNPDKARTLFLVIVIVLHTVFLGVARI